MTTNRLQRVHEEQPLNPRECLLGLLDQLQDKNLHQVLLIELKRLLNDHDRLVHMLQQRSEILENDNQDLKTALDAMQHRHEKAVREMQFFKKKYEKLSNEMAMQVPPTPTTTLSTSHRSVSNMSYGSEFSNESPYHHQGLPPPPLPTLEDYNPSDYPPPPPPPRQKPLMASRSTTTTSSSIDGGLTNRPRQNSSTSTSIYSSTSDTQSVHSANGTKPCSEKQAKHQSNNSVGSGGSKSSWQHLRHPSTSPSTTPTTSTTTSSASTGVRSAILQQRRVDPLTYGGADGLWDTIAKSKGSDVTVEKIISNFLRRGGSPNTAKQHPTSLSQSIKTGYGLIHALILTKASSSLDVLLQHGANPNALSLNPEDPITPCILAARTGWLAGLEKLCQAGGDLMLTGTKSALHVAAEQCHLAIVEYIVQTTRGQLVQQADSQGATALHYACASGHTDLVTFLARTCQIPVLQQDNQGELALHWAARHGRLEVVTLLIERFGVDCNSYVPKKVASPLDLAKSNNHRRLVDYLKGVGALSAKKLDKRREDELATKIPVHFESTLAKHGLFSDADGF